MTTYLVQNIETFETITTFASETAFDAWMSESSVYGIVSLDADADGEYDFVALVAPLDGPDYDVIETPKPKKASKSRKSKTKSKSKTAKTKGAPVSTNTTTTKPIRNFEILVSFIEKYPGVSRTDVFCHQDLLQPLRTPAQRKAIAGGDKLEIKRWNRRLNFLLREAKRQGVDISIERKGRIAHYTVVPASGQLELPFDDAAEARNAAITGADLSVDVEIERPVVDPKRAEEEANQMLDFESLLATLDEDEATITHDDQVAFEEAKKMLK